MPIFKCDEQLPSSKVFQLDEIVCGLREARQKWRQAQNRVQERGGRHLPSPRALEQALQSLIGALFPMRLGPNDLLLENEDYYVGHTIALALKNIYEQVRLEIHYQHRHDNTVTGEQLEEKTLKIVQAFSMQLPTIRELLDNDVNAAYVGDPAARSVDEILLCYPGVIAMIHHRIAHQFYKLNVPLVARIISELAHSQTGIDIHPGASIEAGFFIDHGTGVVIGETAIIGKNVRVYQQVTLGARSFPTDAEGKLQKGMPRHPIVEDDVVIYAGATILGRITIGKGATVGGNVWLTHDVEPGCFVSQQSASQQDNLFSNCGGTKKV